MLGLRLVAAVVFTLVTGLAEAQECATGPAPTCNGTCPTGFVCEPAQGGVPGCECVAGEDLAVTKLAIKLSFAKPASDNIALKALVDVPENFNVDGRMVVVDIGGIVRTFVLDNKGASKSEGAQIKISVKAQKGVVAAQTAKLSFKATKGSFATSLADEGLIDATLTDAPVSVRVDVTMNSMLHTKLQPQLYKATQGKTGKASNPK